ncbi:uncharacterized protein BO97DRAFT_408134 [Aspergillus homomorphus CBS 101889]|uniref:Azaphilone pigments biosynthesis cluster protein L N-terminal domain-containing protein n=1 Tax=Aspergillus homomorphus (strain CBS 101889) TaxID=1450537 RepID=A0A395HML7_ASPHC|nr:hypothetical protein BO97DRAFT_408134 [Aspergillus homomorphus CBS 101889]RAL08739.1 hypothetical protein BO97DRAFT_408134 [Aspergillus homomorphus CBS 101889]
MADPFSTAVNAFGVISLGITVCQSLISYYGPYKAFDEEISDFITRVESLSGTLETLDHQFKDGKNPGLEETTKNVSLVNDSILRCGQGLHKLKIMLAKCRRVTEPAEESIADKLHLKRMLYPLRRDTIKDMVCTVAGLQDNLTMALQSQTIAMMSVQIAQLKVLERTSKATAVETRSLLDSNDRLQCGQHSIESWITSIDRRLQSMESTLVKFRTRPVLEPALLSSLLDTDKKVGERLQQVSQMTPNRRRLQRRGCTCRSPGQSSWPIRSLDVTIRSAICSLHGTGTKVFQLEIRRAFCNTFLNFAVQVSLQVVHGAGGASINPCIRYRAVVPNNSPAFKALSEAEHELRQRPTANVLDDTAKILFQLFRDLKASPSDTLMNGDSISHVLLRWVRHIVYLQGGSIWQSYRAIIDRLVEAGAPLATLNDDGRTPLDALTAWTIYSSPPNGHQIISISRKLMEQGGSITASGLCLDMRLGHDDTYLAIEFARRLAEAAGTESFEFDESFLAVITQSKETLAVAAESYPDLDLLLQKCMRWPAGVSILLKAGYEPNRDSLGYACFSGCPESVRLLLKRRKFCLGRYELQQAAECGNLEIQREIVSNFSEQRRQLRGMAQVHLPSKTLHRLGVRSGCLPGYNAASVCSELNAVSIEIPPLLAEPSEWLIYAAIEGSCDMAQLLWDEGFREVNETDREVHDAIMITNPYPSPDLQTPITFANWLIAHGADISRCCSLGRSGLHHLAKYFGNELAVTIGISSLASPFSYRPHSTSGPDLTSLATVLGGLDSHGAKILHTMLFSHETDECYCPCSAFNGCTPVTELLRGLIADFELLKIGGLQVIVSAIELLVKAAAPATEDSLLNHVALPTIRLCTFSTLEISHTCIGNCEQEVMCEAEVTEIHDEEKERIDLLEQLQVEFEAEYRQRGQRLPQFMMGYWFARMTAVLEAQDAPDEGYIERVQELGVVLVQ